MYIFMKLNLWYFFICSYDMTLTNACLALSQRWMTVSTNVWFWPLFELYKYVSTQEGSGGDGSGWVLDSQTQVFGKVPHKSSLSEEVVSQPSVCKVKFAQGSK